MASNAARRRRLDLVLYLGPATLLLFLFFLAPVFVDVVLAEVVLAADDAGVLSSSSPPPREHAVTTTATARSVAVIRLTGDSLAQARVAQNRSWPRTRCGSGKSRYSAASKFVTSEFTP